MWRVGNLCTFLGNFLVMYNSVEAMDSYRVVFLAILVSCLWGAFTFVQKATLNQVPLEAVFVGSIIVYAIAGSVYIYWHRKKLMNLPAAHMKSFAILIAASIFLSFIPYLIYLYVLNGIDSYIVASIVSAAPLVTLILGVVFLKEKVSILSAFGVFFIIIGVAMIAMHMRKSEK